MEHSFFKPVNGSNSARTTSRCILLTGARFLSVAALLLHGIQDIRAQTGPALVDRNLDVRTVVTGLVTPTTMAFNGPNDLLVLEKNTGRVKRVIDGVIQPMAALDLAVNFAPNAGSWASRCIRIFPMWRRFISIGRRVPPPMIPTC